MRILDGEGRPSRSFVSGQPVRVELDYWIDPAAGGIDNPNFALSVHMVGAGLFYQFESRRDGLELGHCVGAGTLAVELPRLALGEGIYQVGVALADEKGLPEHDWHDRAYRIQVLADGRTEGPVYQPRVWRSLTDNNPQVDSVLSRDRSEQPQEVLRA